MQAIKDWFPANGSWPVLVAAIVLLLALALVFVILRIVVGSRLKTPQNSRKRLPRLGLVDAFDLDRQRQLVIIRRDNVEHLLMIGGPNDLVIEAEIIRAEAREPRLREKDMREKEPKDGSQGPGHAQFQTPAGAAWQPEFNTASARIGASQPQPPRKAAMPPLPGPEPGADGSGTIDEPGAAAPEAAVAAVPAAGPAQISAPRPSLAPRAPAFPSPPRRVTQPSTTPPREPLIRADAASKAETGAGSSSVFPRAPLPTPFARPSPPRQLGRAIAKPAPAPASAAPAASSSGPDVGPSPFTAGSIATDSEAAARLSDAVSGSQTETLPGLSAAEPSEAAAPSELTPNVRAAPPAANDTLVGDIETLAARWENLAACRDAPPPAPPEKRAAAPAFDAIDSLEEEMAKLLGRGPSQ